MRLSPPQAILSVLCGMICTSGVIQAAAAQHTLEDLRPFMQEYCFSCHGNTKAKGEINLENVKDLAGIGQQHDLWHEVLDVVAAGDMPPRKSKQAGPAERKQFTSNLKAILDAIEKANAGDPGLVTLRRLTNNELDNALKELTRQDYRLTRHFPTDSAGGEGFTNTGDTLFLSPELLSKYLAAFRHMASHMSILPASGVRFHSKPVGVRSADITQSDVRNALNKMYESFIGRQLPNNSKDKRIKIAQYLEAAWHWHHRKTLGYSSIVMLAKQHQLHPVFLTNWYNYLTGVTGADNPLFRWDREQFAALPPPQGKTMPEAVIQFATYYDYLRRQTISRAKNINGFFRNAHQGGRLTIKRKGTSTEPLFLVFNDLFDGPTGDLIYLSELQYKQKGNKGFTSYLSHIDSLLTKTDHPAHAAAQTLAKHLVRAPKGLKGIKEGSRILDVQAPQVITLPVPVGTTEFRAKWHGRKQAEGYQQAFFQLDLYNGNKFPRPPHAALDRHFYPHRVSRGATSVRWTIRKHQYGLTKAFPVTNNDIMTHIVRQMNDPREKPSPTIYGFSNADISKVLNSHDRKRFEHALADWQAIRTPNAYAFRRFCQRHGIALTSTAAPSSLPDDKKRTFTSLLEKVTQEQTRLASLSQTYQEHLLKFAGLAWRRPLTAAEAQHIRELFSEFHTEQENLEEVSRSVLVRILCSPHFLYKVEKQTTAREHALSGHELAARLSFMLWAGPPNGQLRSAAADASLLQPEHRQAHVKRMLKDQRVDGFIKEFFGQWLQFHAFRQHKTVDRKRFPAFTDAIRDSMYQQALELCRYVVTHDKPIMELFTADYTLINERLARFYKLPVSQSTKHNSRGFSRMRTAKHGGLFGLGAVLTKTSYPLRTSPVVRGSYINEVILGDHMPPPPMDVDPLPEDDNTGDAKSIREHLLQHRQRAECASCHDKIDPLGFALENYDPIGRWRTQDKGGHRVDNKAVLADGTTFFGMKGLQTYVVARADDVHKQFARKLLGYALGREVLATDAELIAEVVASMRSHNGISAAIGIIVNSRQFTHKRNF